VGALTSFGLSSALGSYGYGYASPAYGYSSMGVYNYLPTWGVSNFSGWGLGSVASNWVYSGYTNPYYATVIAAQPAQTTVVYDYSQPINTTSPPPDASVAESNEQVFSAARDSFKAGDYQRALDLTDQVLKQTPNEAVVHEFRALCLFALKRYDEAASVAYAVLTAGPGWNWSTMVGLYPDVDTYTNQLRALEAYARSNPGSASAQFLLAYQYLAQGNTEAAGTMFDRVVQLQPSDQLSASFVKLYKKAAEQKTALAAQAAQPAAAAQPVQTSAASPAQPGQSVPVSPTQPATVTAEQPPAQAATTTEQPELPPPPPAKLVGSWKAQAAPDVSIMLTLQDDGQFGWEVDNKGQKQSISGHAGFKDGVLALLQEEGPPLVGKITQNDANKFVFAPEGAGDKAPGLTFTR
jgi:thioredoxin-like negative regulator of GroEL